MKTIRLNVEEFSIDNNTGSLLLESGQEYPMTGSFIVFPDDRHGVLINVHNITTVDSNGGFTDGTFKVYSPTIVRCSTAKEKVMIGVPHTAGRLPVIYIK